MRGAIVGLVCFAGSVAAAGPAVDEAFVRDLAAPLIESGEVVGMSIGWIDSGGERRVVCLGVQGLDDPAPVDAATVFEIGSITKLFTGVLLALGAERGELAIDDPVSEHLPEGMVLKDYEGRAITLEDLATHTSGLPPLPFNIIALGGNSLDDPYAKYDAEHLKAFLEGFTPFRPVGENFEYCNLGVGLEGFAVAHAAGTDWETAARERLLGPMGMGCTHFDLRGVPEERRAHGHTAEGKVVGPWSFKVLGAAGALDMCVDDLLRFAALNLETEEARALEEAHPELASAMGVARERRREIAEGQWIGLNWFHQPDGRIGHGGQTHGFASTLLLDPERNTGVVVLSNTGNRRCDEVADRVLDALAGEEVEPIEVRPPVELSEAHLDRLTGIYPLQPTLIFSITREGDALYAQLSGQPKLRIFPRSGTEFVYRSVNAKIVFELPEEGPAVALTLFQNGREMRAERVGE